MTASQPRSRLVVLAAALVSATTMAVAAESWATPAGGGTSANDGSEQQPFPDWFLPIWDANDRNPAVTPDFDFAGLYSTEIRLEGAMRRERS
jgi:hypothetical protein